MDRSPSESSLEKIERTDVIEIANHNSIVMQTKENAEVEKEEAVREATAKCEAEWKQKLEAELASLKSKYEAEKQVRCQLLLIKFDENLLLFYGSIFRDVSIPNFLK